MKKILCTSIVLKMALSACSAPVASDAEPTEYMHTPYVSTITAEDCFNNALVLALPYPTAEYLNNENYFHDYYTDIEISHTASVAHPKSAIQIRNREMVDRADLIICYIEHEKGGAWQTVQYAIEQEKTVINLAEETDT